MRSVYYGRFSTEAAVNLYYIYTATRYKLDFAPFACFAVKSFFSPQSTQGTQRVARKIMYNDWRAMVYYATLALHHYGGEHWDAWNREVREIR